MIVYRSIFAGSMVSIGSIALMSVDNKVLGAFLFSLALLTVIRLKLPLYTGRIGFVRNGEQLIESVLILCGNLIGSIVPLGWMATKLDYHAAAEAKWQAGYIEHLAAGALCGVLIHVAVKAHSDLITVLCIMVFILCGFRHCIADFPFSFHGGYAELGKWSMVVLGNSIGALYADALIGEDNDLRKSKEAD